MYIYYVKKQVHQKSKYTGQIQSELSFKTLCLSSSKGQGSDLCPQAIDQRIQSEVLTAVSQGLWEFHLRYNKNN